MKPLTLLACAVLGAAAAAASAHTPYLAPSNFAPRGGETLALDAAFAETFFVPEAVFDDSRFSVTGPDGTVAAPDAVQLLKTRAVVEHTLPEAPGTYRFSTGPRLGALFRTWEANGKQESSRDPDARIPAGAKMLANFQSLTLAETYVSVGAPDRGALRARGKGLELVPATHPNDLYVGETFEFTVQYDGKPLADQKVEITEAVWTSDRKPQVETLSTDAQGRAVFKLRHAGTWVALSRHRTPAPAGAPVDEYSNSYTLTFRVLEP
ncbi:DUF4198 domain-containing protein [Pseudoxanthomonas putridarboris]|uniref:DUF4198 domain-containing protein n=1 Tax=Pseudoxanthomonas putridarboris TaxID=752605 RepID=A0ABU9J2H9_9GAMM